MVLLKTALTDSLAAHYPTLPEAFIPRRVFSWGVLFLTHAGANRDLFKTAHFGGKFSLLNSFHQMLASCEVRT